MAHRNGGARAVAPTFMTMLIACAMIAVTTSPVSADPPARAAPVPSGSTPASTAPWAVHIAEAAKRFAVPERWIRAVMAVESVNDPAALSRKGAIGLMQIMPATWDELAAQHGLGRDPWEPRANILAGAAYLRAMHDRYGAIAAMLAAYNAGPGRYDEHLASGRALPDETVAYVAKIMPMIDGTTAVASIIDRPLRPTWSRAPLFIARSVVTKDDALKTDDSPLGETSDTPPTADVTALVPLSDGLFVRRPEAEGKQR